MRLVNNPSSSKKPGPPTKPKPNGKNNQVEQQPVEVYCRFRPLKQTSDDLALRAISDTEVQITKRDSNKFGEVYRFKHVFAPDHSTQKLVFNTVALPLVEDLINQRNGLLFTYGVTSAGKTYTITGTPKCPGILPRVLDTLFNTLNKNDLQCMKYVLKPDGANGYDVRSSADAILQQQKELNEEKEQEKQSNGGRTPHRNRRANIATNIFDEWTNRERENEKFVKGIDCDYNYSVFVSFVEIYNNYVYDLLEDFSSASGFNNDGMINKTPGTARSKTVREDPNMAYVRDITEVEVKSANEAFGQYIKGVSRRRIGSTSLNAESSRSHSVFNIRLVRGPIDINGVEVIHHKAAVQVHQLSIVDLAGCERTSRTGATGDRVKEAGNINNSLHTLRKCFDTLRANQKASTGKPRQPVPYRDSKLTTLFRSYFEGNGTVKMIICVNPGASDLNETITVLEFGERSQELMTNKYTATSVNTPLRSYAIPSYPLQKLFNTNEALMNDCVSSALHFGPSYPKKLLTEPDDEKTVSEWIEVTNARRLAYQKTQQHLCGLQSQMRQQLVQSEEEKAHIQAQASRYRMDVEARERQLNEMECRLKESYGVQQEQQIRIRQQEEEIGKLRLEVGKLQALCGQIQSEKERLQQKTVEDNVRLKQEFRRRCIEYADQKRSQIMGVMKSKEYNDINARLNEILSDEDFFRNFKVFNDDKLSTIVNNGTDSVSHTEPKVVDSCSNVQQQQQQNNGNCETTTAEATDTKHAPPVANPRYMNAIDSPAEKWIDHRPAGTMELGTIFKPAIRGAKSRVNLKTSDFIGTAAGSGNKKMSKYALTHHESTASGNIQTQVFKGEIIPSNTGGAQVIFKDVETLKQASPSTAFTSTTTTVANTPTTSDSNTSTPMNSNTRKRVAASAAFWERRLASVNQQDKALERQRTESTQSTATPLSSASSTNAQNDNGGHHEHHHGAKRARRHI